ncbi:MAG: DUF1549 and DUF1553 domain-containing protein [Verrucomicrobia bacterium]|nr:DUF1549 and DUF1553 domain-containing protein [Verrucomicrobiota bacterium]
MSRRKITPIYLKRLWIVGFLLLSASCLFGTPSEDSFTEEQRAYWVFQPISQPKVPTVRAKDWIRNPIDAFILQGIESRKLTPANEADRRTLIRRASLDLLGLPPTPEAVDAFINDPAPNAYEKLIDQLLESPRYGERYARHWLDLVRYADTDGFKADVLRPNAWRYRDYVIESLNSDKSYAQFVQEQIAGDELYPNNDEAKKATGYLRLWPYEDNQPDMTRHWEATLDDIADVSGDVFLGMSMKCARCHDHKFDAITQKDYFRFRSFFSAISPWEDIHLGGEDADKRYRTELATWESMTLGIRTEMEALKVGPLEKEKALARAKLPTYMKEILDKPERTPYEEQLTRFAYKLIDSRSEIRFQAELDKEEKVRWAALEKELRAFDAYKPQREQVAAVKDIGATAPKSYLEGKNGRELIEPGYLSILDPQDATIVSLNNVSETTGQRATLALWLTDEENPLSVRVMVNRLWQWHFGTGIVPSSNDFGVLGGEPSHPELLDWLSRKFVEEGWSLKSMHRLMMTSATYRQSSTPRDADIAEKADADNRYLSWMPVRRMDAEQLRDALLSVSGEIDTTMGGPAVEEENSPRRSIYVINKRNKEMTMMNSFDTPDLHNSCSLRDVTTTPIQALALLNGDWTLSRAKQFADQVLSKQGASTEDRITTAYLTALGRGPTEEDIIDARNFLESVEPKGDAYRTAWADFCHVLMNTNEFVYSN